MITVFQFPTYWGLPNVSPFCLKLLTYLQLANLPYEIKTTTNLYRAPLHKVPFIKDGSETIADSSAIIEYLKRHYGDPLDAELTDIQRAHGVALQRLVEEHLYFVTVYARWQDPRFYPAFTATIFAKLPLPLRWFVPSLVRRRTGKQLWQQGLGRHASEEIYRLGQEDIASCAEFLGSKTFLFGDKPSSYDAVLYAFLENIIVPPLPSPLQQAALQTPQLVAFCERMRKLAFESH